MRNAIIDNATLTAVQRLLGKIVVYNKHTLDGDILAFESLIQSILFFDEIFYIDDYKPEFRKERQEFFPYLGCVELPQSSYDDFLGKTSVLSEDIVPTIGGGVFTDPDFKSFFELLKMHNIFTWDMSSSIYYLTQKMLSGSHNTIDIGKYSKLNQMIFNELNDNSQIHNTPKSIIVDSKGNTISSSHTVIDKAGSSQEAHIGKQVKLLLANLNWLSFRTMFYTLIATNLGGNMVLHPIRGAFQINYLSKMFPQSSEVYRTLISKINSSASTATNSIVSNTDTLITKFPLPMFSALFTSKTHKPSEAINVALNAKNEGDFVRARALLSEIETMIADGNSAKGRTKANKLLLEVTNTMDQLCKKYYVSTPQGISISPITQAYNLGATFSAGTLPIIPDINAKSKFLGKVKDLIPQTGFNSIYKSLVNDLVSIEKLGNYHEMLTSEVSYHRDADFYTSRGESERFKGAKSSWKIPM